MDHPDYVNLLRSADLPPGGLWADLGAGSGAFTLALRELVGPDAGIYAVDKDGSRLGELERFHRARVGDAGNLYILHADFTRPMALSPLDGILMANSLHFFKEKVSLLTHVQSFLKPGGRLLLVEYNVDMGNFWVPYPLSFETYRWLAPRAGFSEPILLATHPSSFLHGFYSAMAYKNEQGQP
jgi:ubiquinone/menaquinone biosynthesis C-methylase UbiE